MVATGEANLSLPGEVKDQPLEEIDEAHESSVLTPLLCEDDVRMTLPWSFINFGTR